MPIKAWVHWLEGKKGNFMFSGVLFIFCFIIFDILFRIRRAHYHRLSLNPRESLWAHLFQALLWALVVIN